MARTPRVVVPAARGTMRVMGQREDEAQGWRRPLADKLGGTAFFALTLATAVSYLGSASSPRITALALYVYMPAILVLAAERFVWPARDYRVRTWLTIATLTLVGLSGA